MPGINEPFRKVEKGDKLPSSREWNRLTGIVERLSQMRRGSRSHVVSIGGSIQELVDVPPVGFNFFNSDSVNTIPSYGIVLNSGPNSDPTESQILPSVKQPDTYGSQSNAWVNSETPVDPLGYGLAQFFDEPMIAAYNPADPNAPPSWGESWGPRASDFYLHSDTGGFRVVDIYDTDNNLCVVVPSPMVNFYGQNQGPRITKGTTGTIEVFSGSPTSPTDSGQPIDGVVALFGDIPANAFVWCSIWQQWSNLAVRWIGITTDLCP